MKERGEDNRRCGNKYEMTAVLMPGLRAAVKKDWACVDVRFWIGPGLTEIEPEYTC